MHALSEVNIGCDSVYIKDLEIFIEKLGVWKSLSQAFKDRDVITDNYNTTFSEPKTEEDRARGYYF